MNKELSDRRLAHKSKKSNRPTVCRREGGYFFFMLNSNIRKINVIIDVITKQTVFYLLCKVKFLIYIVIYPSMWGRQMMTLKPSFVFSAVIVPWCFSTMAFVIARPMPALFGFELSAR